MNAFVSSNAEAVDHIQVTREILLEKGNAVTPYAIAQTKDGSYVIVGAIGNSRRWATKVDASGNVLWRYSAEVENRAPGEAESKYESVVVLSDDSALLCGWKNINGNILGVLTQIDKLGEVLSDRTLRPQEDKKFKLNYLNKCVVWGDGVAVAGTADSYTGEKSPRHHESYSWLLALDSQLNIKWEKLFPIDQGIGVDVVVSPNQDLLGYAIRVNHRGEVDPVKPPGNVHRLVVGPANHSLTQQEGKWAVRMQLLSQGERYSVPGKSDMTRSNAEYFLPDHSMVEFGSKSDRNVDIAAIAWLSSNSTEAETFVFKPFWQALQVNAALPTGKPGEFVTVRQVVPPTSPPDPERFGIVLAFINIQ